VGVGPLILVTVFTLTSVDASSAPRRRRFFTSSGVGGWGWEFFEFACSSPRERVARPNDISFLLVWLQERTVDNNLQHMGSRAVIMAVAHLNVIIMTPQPSSSYTHNVGNTHSTTPRAYAMGEPFANSNQRSMLEFQHSVALCTHSTCLRAL
jgi:hypothetical protein